LRDLHFDVLIALTARTHGARLITSNRSDFELIQSYRDFRLEAPAVRRTLAIRSQEVRFFPILR
jgi:predicted nucleic acid-binding protein